MGSSAGRRDLFFPLSVANLVESKSEGWLLHFNLCILKPFTSKTACQEERKALIYVLHVFRGQQTGSKANLTVHSLDHRSRSWRLKRIRAHLSLDQLLFPCSSTGALIIKNSHNPSTFFKKITHQSPCPNQLCRHHVQEHKERAVLHIEGEEWTAIKCAGRSIKDEKHTLSKTKRWALIREGADSGPISQQQAIKGRDKHLQRRARDSEPARAIREESLPGSGWAVKIYDLLTLPQSFQKQKGEGERLIIPINRSL